MPRVNIYDQDDMGTVTLIGWFNDATCTETVDESTYWDGENHRGVVSGLQVGYEALLRTAKGRWVRHYDARNEFNGPEIYEFLTDEQARTWLMKSNDAASEKVLTQYFGEPEEESGPSKGGRPRVGEPISVAYPEDLLERIDAAAQKAGIKRAAWLRQAAEAALSAQGESPNA